jgi:hypothetical protein
MSSRPRPARRTTYSPDFLAAKLPTAGSSFTDVRRYEGESLILAGVYELTTVVTRVA